MCRTAVRAQGLVLQGSGSGSGERTARARAASCSYPSWPSRSPARPNRQTRPSATRPPTHGVGVAWHGVGWHGVARGGVGCGWHGHARGCSCTSTRVQAPRARAAVCTCWHVHGVSLVRAAHGPARVGVDVFGPPRVGEEGRLIQGPAQGWPWARGWGWGTGLRVGLRARVTWSIQADPAMGRPRPSQEGARAGKASPSRQPWWGSRSRACGLRVSRQPT